MLCLLRLGDVVGALRCGAAAETLDVGVGVGAVWQFQKDCCGSSLEPFAVHPFIENVHIVSGSVGGLSVSLFTSCGDIDC